MHRRSTLLAALPALLLLSGLGPAAVPRYVFVTSVEGSSELASWPDAQGEVGAAAGDAICAARANAAGLPEPTSYVAWISTTVDDAYCRVHGLSGKVADLCGQPSLPAAAGPWRRTAGQPFALGISELVSGAVLTPPRFDEFGETVALVSLFTATSADGTLDPFQGTCSDWTAVGAFTRVLTGNTEWTTTGWTQRGYGFCSLSSNRLICFGRGPATPLAIAPAGSARLAFVTADVGSGDLSTWPGAGGEVGIAAGDAICRDRAGQAGLPHSESYKAWLSDLSALPQDRFDHDGPWFRPDGVLVADSLAALSTPLLAAPPNLTETGVTFLGPNDPVWSRFGCLDWTHGGLKSNGSFGRPSATNAQWSAANLIACDALNHLYCFADLPWEVFVDGFESGDTTFWSSATP